MSLIPEKDLIRMQIYNIVSDVNMIVSYKFVDKELERWAETIVRLFPYVTAEVVAQITDNFLTGVEEFEKDAGILNYTYKIPKYSGRTK